MLPSFHLNVYSYSWSGILESMQYFATVIPDSEEVRAEQIMWLSKDKIEDQVKLDQKLKILATDCPSLSLILPPDSPISFRFSVFYLHPRSENS